MASISEKKLQHQGSTPKRLDIHYLKSITNNFSEDQILGHGGYGIVYKGEQENGEVVAVKKLIMSMAGLDDKQFMNEVKHAMDICHPNIVRLEGYCYQTEKELTFHNGYHIFVDEVYRLLCFEYLPNGSLDRYISDESSGLDWHTRYNIIQGICTGLYCLHEGRQGAPILHLDLKPSNILLDKNMTPKIADFGLSRIFAEGKTHTFTTNVTGSRGYMAPEYIDSKILSKESDIFSLGVIIIEIVAGQRKYPEGTTSEEFIEVYEKWRTRLQKTSNKTSLEEDCRQVDECIEVGLKCMNKDPKRRPNIREIVEIIGRTECSAREDGSVGEEQTRKWREKLDIIVSGSAEQSIEALKAISIELNDWIFYSCVMPKYIMEDADNLFSSLTLMVQKTFGSNIVRSSSRHCKCTLNIIMQVVQIRHLVCAVKKGTLEEFVTEMLIWIVKMDEEVVKMEEGSLLKELIFVVDNILENADRTSLFVIIINLLRPLDPSRWPCSTPLELLAMNSNRLSDFVAKCLLWLNKHLESTINDLDLDLILQSINAFLEQVGVNELQRRAANDDKPVLMVLTLLRELVKLVGSKINGHLSMLPIGGCWSMPVILAYIDIFLKDLAAARTLVPPTDQTSHGDDAASCSTNPSTLSPSEDLAAARTSVSPTGQTSHGGDAASSSTNASTLSPSEDLAAATTSVLPTGQTSHEGDVASNSTNPSDLSLLEVHQSLLSVDGCESEDNYEDQEDTTLTRCSLQ